LRLDVSPGAPGSRERVRRAPEQAYDVDFFESFAREVGWRLGP